MAKECVWLAGLAWVCIVGWVGVGAGWCGDSYLDGEFDEGHTNDDVTYITTVKVTYSYLDGEFDEGHGNRGDDIKGKASCHIVL